MKKALYKFIHDNIMFLFIPGLGITLSIILLTISFTLYEGGIIRATHYYMRQNKSVLSVGLKNSDSFALSNSVLNWEDGEKVKQKLSNIDDIIVACEGVGSLSSELSAIPINATGVNHAFWNIDNEKVLYGRLTNDEDTTLSKSVIIINEKASLALFNTRDAIGKTVDIKIGGSSRSLSVIGVLKDPYFYEESVCYFPYAIFSQDSYEKSWISIAIPSELKNDYKDKLTKVLYDRYGTDIYEAHEYKQLIFIENLLKQNGKAFYLLIIMCIILGLFAFTLGVSNYLEKHKEKMYVLKTFGVKDDIIKIKLFNQLSLHGLFILIISITLGYLAALIPGSMIFIKPVLSIKYIFFIASFGYIFIALAILISLKRLKTRDIL